MSVASPSTAIWSRVLFRFSSSATSLSGISLTWAALTLLGVISKVTFILPSLAFLLSTFTFGHLSFDITMCCSSFAGWIMETISISIRNKKFVNRGFLIGPVCPIYGYGVVLVSLLLQKYQNDIIVTFFMSIIICGFLEYFTSYFMEIIFKARWWDYSQRKFNINGRVCLENLVLFGLA